MPYLVFCGHYCLAAEIGTLEVIPQAISFTRSSILHYTFHTYSSLYLYGPSGLFPVQYNINPWTQTSRYRVIGILTHINTYPCPFLKSLKNYSSYLYSYGTQFCNKIISPRPLKPRQGRYLRVYPAPCRRLMLRLIALSTIYCLNQRCCLLKLHITCLDRNWQKKAS